MGLQRVRTERLSVTLSGEIFSRLREAFKINRIKSKPERNSNAIPVDDICKGQPCCENTRVRMLRREMMWKNFSCNVYIYIFTEI